MPDVEMLARAGLTLLGDAGTPEDVRSDWKVFISAGAEPHVRVSDSMGELALTVLDRVWNVVAERMGIIASDGAFLLSVEGRGTFGEPWLHVRTEGIHSIRDLGPYQGEPGFIASSMDRSASVAVTTEESEFWILVRRGGESLGADR